MKVTFAAVVWDVIDELIKFLGAPSPFDFMLKLVLGFWFVFLVFLLFYFPILILIRVIRGRR